MIDSDKIWFFFRYFQQCMRGHGRNVVFPKNTNPQKTYKWRYIERFAKRVEEWGIDDNAACKVISAVVNRSKSTNMLNKGAAMLASNDVLDVGRKALLREENREENVLSTIKRDRAMLEPYQNKIDVLLKRDSPKSMPNIVKWYIQHRLSSVYLAVSKSCGAAMVKLSPEDRLMLPSGKSLLTIKNDFLNNAIIKTKVRLILDDEWETGRIKI